MNWTHSRNVARLRVRFARTIDPSAHAEAILWSWLIALAASGLALGILGGGQ
jgi:hypothetical protein